jgi:hypothetical protein
MKPLNARTIALVGFAASQWASERINGSRHKRRCRQLIAAGLALHESGELYASAPKMRRALATIAKHAAPLALVVLLAGCATDPIPDDYETAEPVATMEVATLPPGALVYLNAEYIGTSPVTVKLVADRFGKWKQDSIIRAVVPHDTVAFEEMVYPRGYRVPSRVLLRVPGYTHWYSATQPQPPQPLTINP